MSKHAIPFPQTLPSGYEWFVHEPLFEPAIHLALESPEEVIHLDALGYKEEDMQGICTTVAASSPFRILSDEGAAVMLEVARSLRAHAISCERIDNMVRSGCYRSKFLRDLCLDPSVTALLCDVYGVDVAPHTMPVHLGHLNYSPDDLSKAVDKWHHDTLSLDYVMMVTDPQSMDGGRFEYFSGTKSEMAALAAQGKTPPADRVVAPHFPAPGYAIALHGNMVVHRGAGLSAPAERITMVNGYVATDTASDDQHRHKDLTLVDDPQCLYTEWAKHSAWRARERLDTLIAELEFTADRQSVANRLEEAIKDLSRTIIDMRDDGKHHMHHYETGR